MLAGFARKANSDVKMNSWKWYILFSNLITNFKNDLQYSFSKRFLVKIVFFRCKSNCLYISYLLVAVNITSILPSTQKMNIMPSTFRIKTKKSRRLKSAPVGALNWNFWEIMTNRTTKRTTTDWHIYVYINKINLRRLMQDLV